MRPVRCRWSAAPSPCSRSCRCWRDERAWPAAPTEGSGMSQGQIAEADPQWVVRCFEAQQATALRLRSSTADERKRKLVRLREALLDRRDALCAAFQADFRKPAAEVELT